MVDAAVLRYLAVAHFGRGRGDWSAGEAPPFWVDVVTAAITPQRSAFASAWAERDERGRDAAQSDPLEAALNALLTTTLHDVLALLYPDTPIVAWPAEDFGATTNGVRSALADRHATAP
jgi:hypothetical protein